MELVAWLSVGAFIVEQYILPSCLNSLHPLHTMDIGHVLERVLKLSLPSLYVWLIGFYSLFHLWLNILAELTYFGDREFYKVLHQMGSQVPAIIPFLVLFLLALDAEPVYS